MSQQPDIWHRKYMGRADWELEAELEHCFRLELDAEPDSLAALAWRYYALRIEEELVLRAQKRYERARAPFDSKSLLERLDRAVDVLSVIGSRCPQAVQRAPRWSNGRVQIRCPFHEDRSPSMTVYANEGRWWCHACNFGGDSIDFVQRSDGLTFMQACLKLANEFGVDVPKASARANGIEVPTL